MNALNVYAPRLQRFLRQIWGLRSAPVVATCSLVFTLGMVDTSRAESLLLKGATVHPVSSSTLASGQVWIKDGKIAAVGAEVEAPGAQVVDLSGTHLYPGLIAATTSLGLTEINAVRATRDNAEVGGFTPDVRSWVAVNPDSELLPVARANGITHFVPVPEGGVIAGQSGLMVMDGWTMEDMTIRHPVAMHLHWPSMDLDLTPKGRLKDASKWKSPEDLAKARRLELVAIEDFFRQAAVYARSREAASPDVLVNPPWEAMRPVLDRKIPVIVHAADLRQIKAAMSWAATNRVRVVIAGAREAAPVAALLASNQIPVIVENVFSRQMRDTESYDSQFRLPGLLQQAGVLLAISVGIGDSNETEVRNLAHHAAQAVAFGLPPDEAIKAVTLNPAKILGVADRIGSIEVGKDATLIAVTGDLLDIRNNVRQMWIAGHPVNLENRHTRLYDKYRARPIAK